MKLKSSSSVDVSLEANGKICIEQFSLAAEMLVEIHLTIEQFNSIANWVFKNKDEIELTWNEGVENDSNS